MLLDEPTREQVRAAAERVFARGEFQQHRSIIQRILDWIERHLPRSSAPSVSGASGGSALASLLLYLFFAAVVALVVWIVYRAIRDRVRRREPEAVEDPEPIVEEVRSGADWRREAETAEAEGRWKDALLARYRELVAELVEREVADPVPGRTTGELRVDVARNAPEAAAPFDEATVLFELPWYGHADTGPDESARFAAAATRVLAGTERRP